MLNNPPQLENIHTRIQLSQTFLQTCFIMVLTPMSTLLNRRGARGLVVSTFATHASGPGAKPVAFRGKKKSNLSDPQD